ncbi:DUF724 domain-containing protein 6-like isoform X3 [Coffea arabica]|uniref:DUF724 domain-containing protein 6-like isoform X3 n=1 Tax=Coffea arabica TaxID=13443 RepID=A0A6P6WTG4_COFAR
MKSGAIGIAKQQQSSPFSVGSLVEVTSDEEGFQGAWYLATLLRPPSSSSSPTRSASSSSSSTSSAKKRKSKFHPNSKAYVQYHTLVAEEGSNVPLRESVNAEFLRPLPPPDPPSSEPYFDLGDVVDAYYRDGWWTGVVTALLLHHQDADRHYHHKQAQSSPLLRFVVTFHNPPDELHFAPSQLRFHRRWVNCTWVRPAKQRAAGLMFSVGKRVEVSFDREDWRDTWFPATILEDIGNDSFLVEYHCEDAAPLRATVNFLHIRPCPPHLKDKNFVLLEKVDAYYHSGWWPGVITKALADCRYNVFFKHTKRDGEFNHTDLRPHMEWKDGKWFTSSQDILHKLDYEKPEGHVYNNVDSTEVRVPLGNSGFRESNSEEKAASSLNLGENQVELPTPCSEEALRVYSLPEEKTQETPVCGGEEILKEEMPAGMPSLTASQPCTEATTGTTGKANSFDLASPSSESIGNNLAKQPSGGDQSSENHTWGKRVKRKRIKTSEEDDNRTSGSGRTSSSSRKVQVKSPTTSSGSREGDAGVDAAEGVQEECVTTETNLPVVLGLECDKGSNSSTRKACLSGGEELSKLPDNHVGLNDNGLSSIKDSIQLDSEEKIPKRRRGRPRKVATNSSITLASEEPRKEVIIHELLVKDCLISENDSLQDVEVKSAMMDSSVPGQECVINGSGKHIIRSQEKQKNKTGSTAILSALRKLSEEVVEATTKQQERHSSKRGRRRTVNLNSVSQVQDSPNSSGSKVTESSCMTKELENVVEELPANTFEDQPLSKWFQMNSPTTNDASRLSPTRSVEQCAVASNGQLAIVNENHAVDKQEIVTCEVQNLPFVKNTLLWSTLESMQVFQKLPQKPHFQPLEQCKESSREGLAIGFMVTFSSVVERTSRLKFDDPKSTIDDILETLVELESHGFDVGVVRDRVTHLMTMKDEQEKLQDQVEQLHGEIEKHNLEKSKFDEEEEEINNQMKNLQEKLSQVASMKATKDREITSLQSKLEGIRKGITNVQSDFQGLATLV